MNSSLPSSTISKPVSSAFSTWQVISNWKISIVPETLPIVYTPSVTSISSFTTGLPPSVPVNSISSVLPSGLVILTFWVAAPLEPFWIQNASLPSPGTFTLIPAELEPILIDLLNSIPSHVFVLFLTSVPPITVNLPATISSLEVPVVNESVTFNLYETSSYSTTLELTLLVCSEVEGVSLVLGATLVVGALVGALVGGVVLPGALVVDVGGLVLIQDAKNPNIKLQAIIFPVFFIYYMFISCWFNYSIVYKNFSIFIW